MVSCIGKGAYLSGKPIESDQMRETAVAELARTNPPIDAQIQSAEKLLEELQVHQIELEIQNEELRRTQISLEESRDSFLDFYEFSPVGYFTLTDKGLITNANLTGAALLGVDREKLLQQPFSRYLIPDDVDHWYLHFVSVLKKVRVKLNCELTLQHENGFRLYVRLDSLCLVRSNHHSLVRVVMTDISEHKSMEMALQQSEELKTATLNSLSEQIAVLDHEGIILEVNEAWRRFAIENGTEPGKPAMNTAVGLNYLDFCHESSDQLMDGALLAHDGIRAVLENRLPNFSMEYPCHSPNHFRWFQMFVTRLNMKKGGAVISHTNITARKMAEIDLHIAAATFESRLGVLISDANNVIIRVNHAFTQITGYSEQEAIGKTPRLMNSGRQNADFYAAMWNSIKRTGGWDGEIWNKRKSGEIYPEHLNITAVKNNSGTIQYYVATLADITMSRQAADEIRQLAFYDTLTRLPNRQLLLDRLKLAIADSTRSGREGALLFIDLDNFKILNETLGHDVGDLLLQQVAYRLESCVRVGDTVARLGGDEFVVMLENLGEKSTEALAQTKAIGDKILAVLTQPYQLDSHHHLSTPSIGITLFKENKYSLDDLLKQADIAMYQAKKAGRNTLRFFDPQMQDIISARVSLEKDLRLALEKRQFKLFFQLQVTHNRQAIGAEVLIRWDHPHRGLVSPIAFIPLAEETGLIIPIGLWVLETACAQLKLWESDSRARHLQLAVNVSARQFNQVDFVEQVQQVLNRHAINPSRLKFELTESLVIDNIEETIIKMNAIREIGVHFSMDDFGTGHSSLSNLKKLPLDQLKIDQSFVRDIATDPDDATIVKTIIAMAGSLGMDVIAEGVETEEQRAFLEQHGCPLCQGYLFGKPLPIKEFEASLK